jgi:hypothetical protein
MVCGSELSVGRGHGVYLLERGAEVAKVEGVWWIRGLGWGEEGFLLVDHREWCVMRPGAVCRGTWASVLEFPTNTSLTRR